MGIIKRQSLKSSIANYIGVALGAVFLLVVFPNIISKEFLGFVQLLIGLTLVFAQLVCVGTQNVLYKYFNEWKDTKRLDNYNALVLKILPIAFIAFGILYLIFKNHIIRIFSKDSEWFINYYWVLLPLIFIQAITYYLEVYSTMRLRVTVPTFLREVFNRLLLIVIIFLLAYNVVSETVFIFLYIFIYLISLFVLAFYAVRFFNFRIGHSKSFFIDNKKIKEQFSYGKSATAITFIGNAHNFVDTIMLPAYLGFGALGIYARPLILGQMIHVPYRSIANISSPIIMEAWANNDVKKIEDLNKKISVNLLLIGLFLFTLVVVNADNFFNLIPPAYSTGKNVLFIIAFGRLVDMSFGLNTEILFSSKYYKWTVYFTVVMVATAILLNIILIPLLDMDGAAIAVAVSLIVFNILKAVFIYKKFHFHSFSKPYISLIFIAALTIGITYFIIPDISSSGLNQFIGSPVASVFLNIIFKSTIALILFIAPVLILNINQDFTDFFKLIISGKILKGGHKMEEL